MKYIVLFLGHALALLFAVNLIAAEVPDDASIKKQQVLGAYLTRAGNCRGCHTTRGGIEFAGGRRLSTSFGIFVTPNITPDKETGIGLWNANDFWQAMHHGKSRDGRLLYPACPYTEYTKVTRQDIDAIFAYLQSLPSISQVNATSEIYFPYNFKILLTIWRTLYFNEGVYTSDRPKSEAWNRGAYLVQGLGHCNACHTTRNLLGASDEDTLSGGKIMGLKWYAPSLSSHLETGGGDWTLEEYAEILSIGISKRAVASGSMATIVGQSLQYLTPEDIHAMAVYLKSLMENYADEELSAKVPVVSERTQSHFDQGEKLYESYCKTCHGASGEGVPGIYPPLAGNRSVIMASPVNTIRSVLYGGYPATTTGNPRPYGMPPFQQIFRDDDVAHVVFYIRNAWGNRGNEVTAVDVDRSRGGDY